MDKPKSSPWSPPDLPPPGVPVALVEGVPVAEVDRGVLRFDVSPPAKFSFSEMVRRGVSVPRSVFDAAVKRARAAGKPRSGETTSDE